MAKKAKPRRVLEKDVERDVIRALNACGFAVYRLSQGYRPDPGGTRQTAGIPDVYAVHRVKRVAIWVEVKTPAGLAMMNRLTSNPPRLSQLKEYRRAVAQQAFADLMAIIDHPYARGGRAELIDELLRIGVLEKAA